MDRLHTSLTAVSVSTTKYFRIVTDCIWNISLPLRQMNLKEKKKLFFRFWLVIHLRRASDCCEALEAYFYAFSFFLYMRARARISMHNTAQDCTRNLYVAKNQALSQLQKCLNFCTNPAQRCTNLAQIK